MSNQPKWKYVGNLGDKHPLDHGGCFVFVDETGVYGVEMELLSVDEVSSGKYKYEASRILCDKCTFIDGILSDNKFHPGHAAWFANKDPEHKARHGYDQWHNLCQIAESIELTPEAFAAQFCSDDPMTRARAYMMVVSYHGAYEFDQDPLKLTRREAQQRYKDCKPT